MRFTPLFATLFGIMRPLEAPAFPVLRGGPSGKSFRNRIPGKHRPAGSKLARLAERGRVGVWSQA